jgi:hypothetical protein
MERVKSKYKINTGRTRCSGSRPLVRVENETEPDGKLETRRIT